MTSRNSSSVESSGLPMSMSTFPSSVGFEPESGSVSPSFTSIARARRMISQTLSKAISINNLPPFRSDVTTRERRNGSRTCDTVRPDEGSRRTGEAGLDDALRFKFPVPYARNRYADPAPVRLERVHDLRLVRAPQIQDDAAV